MSGIQDYMWGVFKQSILGLISDGVTDEELQQSFDAILDAAHAGEDIEPEDNIKDDDETPPDRT